MLDVSAPAVGAGIGVDVLVATFWVSARAVGAGIGVGVLVALFWAGLWANRLRVLYPPTRAEIVPGGDWQVVEGIARSAGEEVDAPVAELKCLAWGIRDNVADSAHYKSTCSKAACFKLQTKQSEVLIESGPTVHVMGTTSASHTWTGRDLHTMANMKFIAWVDEVGCDITTLPVAQYRQVAIQDGDEVTVVGRFTEVEPASADQPARLRLDGDKKRSPRCTYAYVVRGTRAETIGRFGPGIIGFSYIVVLISWVCGFTTAMVYDFIFP